MAVAVVLAAAARLLLVAAAAVVLVAVLLGVAVLVLGGGERRQRGLQLAVLFILDDVEAADQAALGRAGYVASWRSLSPATSSSRMSWPKVTLSPLRSSTIWRPKPRAARRASLHEEHRRLRRQLEPRVERLGGGGGGSALSLPSFISSTMSRPISAPP